MAPKAHYKIFDADTQADFQEALQERLRLAIRYTLITILEEEVEAFCQAAAYQRTPQRRDYRNGTYVRSLGTTQGVIADLPVPRTREGFQTHLFERYQRRMAELDEAICGMFIAGVSAVGVGRVTEALSGHCFAGLSLAGNRVRSLEDPPVASALLVCVFRWHLFHGQVQRRRLQKADFSHRGH